jgi:hypothetical protein
MFRTADIQIRTAKPPLISGTRNAPHQTLYNVGLPLPVHHSINLLTHESANAVNRPHLCDRIAFYHATMFSPVISTWTDAINAGFLDSIPKLTAKQVHQYQPHSEATTMGHIHAQRSNPRSTKPPKPAPDPPTYAEVPRRHSTTEPSLKSVFRESSGRTHHIYTDCQTITGQAGSDQTGCFVVQSTSGNNYIFVLYDYDSNSIHAKPIPNRKQASIKTAYETVLRLLQRRGLRPKLHRLDNEASQLLKDFMTDEYVDYQLTPPGLHRRNWAERAIQTFKNHFISGLCSTHPDFPLNLWDKLLPQATLTLNLLRPSRINPKLSAYAQICGAFNFDKTPLAPPGIKVHTHERAEGRETFSVHSARDYYVGPCLHYYRCYNVWIPTMNSICIANTVDWFPHNLTMPTSSATDILLATAKDLTAALRQSQRNPLLPPPNTQTRQALVQLKEIFSNVTKPTITTNAALPRVPNVKIPTHAALPRVPLTTTNDYLTMTATNRRLRRQNQHLSKKAPPATPPSSSLPHLESNNSAFTDVQLPPKL